MKKYFTEIIVASLLLAFFLYLDIKNDFPALYIGVLILAYVSIVIYKIIQINTYKKAEHRFH